MDVEAQGESGSMYLVLNTLLSAAFAGAVAVAVTAAIEKWGGALGGMLGTVPSTIVPLSFGVAFQEGSNYTKLKDTLFVVPLGMASAVFFLFLWRIIPPFLPLEWTFKLRLTTMIGSSLLGWLCWSTVIYFGLDGLQGLGFTIPQIGTCAAIALLLLSILGACYHPLRSAKGSNKVSAITYFARSLVAAVSVGLGVLVSKWSPVLAGIFACFPSIFLTTMVSLWISQGESVPTSAVGPMMLGSASVYIYAIFFALAFPYFVARWALAWAVIFTSISMWLLAVIGISLPVYFGLRWRQSCTSATPTDITTDEEVLNLKSASDSQSGKPEPLYGTIKESP